MKLWLVLFLFLLFQQGFTKTFYISPNGNDITGNGSITNPWQTLFKATTIVTTPGDIIHVVAGNYRETASCNLAVGVSLEGEGKASVIQSTLTEDWIPIISAHSREGTDGNQSISYLTFDGSGLSTFWAIWITGRSNVSIHHCTIVDFKDRGVLMDGRNDNLEAAPGIYATGNIFHDNTIINCAAYNTNNGIYGRGCLNIGGQDGMQVFNNTIIQNARPDGFNGWPIKFSNGGYLKNVKLYNNVLVKKPYTGDFGGEKGWDFAIELWNILGGVEIYGNKIQGSIDLVKTSNDGNKYGAWIHNNIISQPVLNKYFESGVVLEFSTESVIIENNKFDKIAGGIIFNAQENTEINNILIRKNEFTGLGRNTGHGNNGNGINFNAGVLQGRSLPYYISNVAIENNIFSADQNNAPYYGISISGATQANNIRIMGNTIENFRISGIIANPAMSIDSLFVENNIFAGNGNGNRPFYIMGTPGNYIIKNNIRRDAASGINPGFDVKQQLIRPLYYEAKNINLLEIISMISILICLLFCIRENIYAFPFGIISSLIFVFLKIEQEDFLSAAVGLSFVVGCIFIWMKWEIKSTRRHKAVYISSASLREILIESGFFMLFFILSYSSIYLVFPGIPANRNLAEAFVISTLFTGLYSLMYKKIESWYWLLLMSAALVLLYYFEHYLYVSIFSGALVLVTIAGLISWKKKQPVRQTKKNSELTLVRSS